MKRQFKRTDRVAEFIQRELSLCIQNEIKDPRLPKFVTISNVDVSADFAHAKIYFTILTGDKQQTESILNSAASYLRTQLAKNMKMFTVPQLHFLYDASVEYGNQLSQLIDKLNTEDHG